MLENFKNGSSVKILYTYKGYENNNLKTYEKELKGLLYKENLKSNEIVLVSNSTFNRSNQYNWIPNVFYLKISGIKDIAPTRFKKEVSEVLNKQYKNILEAKKVKEEIERLKQLQNKLNKDIEKNSIDLFNILSQTNLKDMTSWSERLKRDFENERYEHVYDSNSKLSYSFNKLVNKGQFAEITLHFYIAREERLLSKEFEDRIRRNESISKNDVYNYTPEISKFNRVFKDKAVISNLTSGSTIQDKGWVSFYLNLDLTFKVDLKEYDKWFKQVTSYINTYFPKENTEF